MLLAVFVFAYAHVCVCCIGVCGVKICMLARVHEHMDVLFICPRRWCILVGVVVLARGRLILCSFWIRRVFHRPCSSVLGTVGIINKQLTN